MLQEIFVAFVGDGFQKLAAKLMSIGAKYGTVPVSEVLPSARTVSRHVHEVVTSSKAALMREIAGIGRFGVTTDGWTHEGTSTPYITVTLHYIDEVCLACHCFVIINIYHTDKHAFSFFDYLKHQCRIFTFRK